MERKEYTIKIHAPRKKVWDVLWDDKTFRQWTAAFMEGSHAKSDWEEGSEIQFLGPENSGMVAIIEKKQTPEKMLFKHIVIIENGKKDTTSKKVKEWAPAMENYLLTEKEGTTTLKIEMDIDKKHVDMFDEIWPKALQKVKDISEDQQSNPSVWFEIYVDDITRAKQFYETVLETKLEDQPLPEGSDLNLMQMKFFPSNMERFGCSGALVKMEGFKAGSNSTIIYFHSKDCSTEEKRVKAAGGKVFKSKMSIGNYGFITLAIDTEGNMFGLHSMN